MKRDQTNKTNAEGVYRWQALAWEPGPGGSGVDLRLFQEWARCSHTSCAHHVGVGVEWRQMRSDRSGVWKGASQGGGQRGDKRKEGKREVIP